MDLGTFVQVCFDYDGCQPQFKYLDRKQGFGMRVQRYFKKGPGFHTYKAKHAKEHLLRLCTNGPPLASCSIAFPAKASAGWQERKQLAQQIFAFLQHHEGFLVFCLAGDAEDLLVTHLAATWSIDHEACIVSPPKLDFDTLPTSVVGIKGRIYSKGSPQGMAFRDSFDASDGAEFDLECSEKVKFAYNGNVDIEAWVDEQHQQANDFYANPDDYEYMNESDDDLVGVYASDYNDSHGDHSGPDE